MTKYYIGEPKVAEYVITRSPADPKLFCVFAIDSDAVIDHAVIVDVGIDEAVAKLEELKKTLQPAQESSDK